MTMVSLGDLARTLMMQRHVTATKTAIQQLSQEVTTGLVSDAAAHMRGNLAPLHALEARLTRLGAYASSAADLQQRAQAMQAGLDRLHAGAAGLASDLATAGSGGAVGLPGMAAAGEAGFLSAVAALNTALGGRYLFSGTASDQPPLPAGEDMLAQLRDHTAGAISLADLQQRVEAWFADPVTFGYAGTAAGRAIPLAEGENLALPVTAADPVVGQMLAGFALAALLQDNALQEAGQADLAAAAAQALQAAQPGVIALAAQLGQAEERIAEAQGRTAAESSALELARVELLKVDDYESATQLTAAQDRLDLLFAVTARISGLRLADYLR